MSETLESAFNFTLFQKPIVWEWCEFLQIVSRERELIHSQKLGTGWVLINSENLPMIWKRTYFPILFPRYGNSHLPCFRGRIDSCFNTNIFNFFLLLFLWYGNSIVPYLGWGLYGGLFYPKYLKSPKLWNFFCFFHRFCRYAFVSKFSSAIFLSLLVCFEIVWVDVLPRIFKESMTWERLKKSLHVVTCSK